MKRYVPALIFWAGLAALCLVAMGGCWRTKEAPAPVLNVEEQYLIINDVYDTCKADGSFVLKIEFHYDNPTWTAECENGFQMSGIRLERNK